MLEARLKVSDVVLALYEMGDVVALAALDCLGVRGFG
jgi:hypothetical protein